MQNVQGGRVKQTSKIRWFCLVKTRDIFLSLVITLTGFSMHIWHFLSLWKHKSVFIHAALADFLALWTLHLWFKPTELQPHNFFITHQWISLGMAEKTYMHWNRSLPQDRLECSFYLAIFVHMRHTSDRSNHTWLLPPQGLYWLVQLWPQLIATWLSTIKGEPAVRGQRNIPRLTSVCHVWCSRLAQKWLPWTVLISKSVYEFQTYTNLGTWGQDAHALILPQYYFLQYFIG